MFIIKNINNKQIINKMNKIVEIYKKNGKNGYIGEKVTQFEHAMQCFMLADDFLKKNNEDKYLKTVTPYEIKLGAFLHDIGHLLCYEHDTTLKQMGDYGVMEHEIVGFNYLKQLGISMNICNLVKNHINTKRYLISKDNNYYDKLSEASKNTFKFQGGIMSENEMIEFENDSLFYWNMKLREWDDKAKSTDPELLKYINNILII